ncbi:MAG: response regulator [Myxococcaceae bacterium]|nr:response regulator [Myxococcaceae bacterium]
MPQPILVVDDDRFFREVVTDILSKKGYRVVAVDTATRALEAYARGPFDLVITDLVMPGVDGLQLVAALREHQPDQEIILVSTRKDVNASMTALKAGVADYLVKPVEEGDLVLAVERCLERALLRRERARLLTENLDLARYQTIHNRCLEILSNPDLEWLQERLLAELSSLCDAQSAALWVVDDRGHLALRAYRGLLDKERLPEKLKTDEVLAARIREGKAWLSGEGRTRMLHVPMVTAGETIALAQLSDPLAGEFKPDHLRDAQILADFAAIGLRNGRKILGLQRLGLRDRDTAAYNLSYFTDYASKEIYKARRYGRTFSLLTFSIDNLPNIRLRLGAADARRATRGIIRALSKIIRDSDVIAKASEQEFYMLLPETDFFGALMFARRADAAVREEPEVREIEERLPVALVGGAATFPKDGEDFDELVHKCRRRMEERRVSLQRRLVLDGLPFWDEVELLLGSAQSPRLPTDDRAEPSRRGKVSSALFEELQTEVARELLRDPTSRGLLYVGGPEIRADLPVATGLDAAPPEFAPRVYVLGRRHDLDSHPALTPVFLEGDERLARHEFLLWLSEHSAYALIQRPGRGATWGFHTSDPAVVDGLIARLQSEYDLQPW